MEMQGEIRSDRETFAPSAATNASRGMMAAPGGLWASRKFVTAWLAGIAVFMLFCTPSMKIFVYTEALNAIPPVLLLTGVLISPATSLSHPRIVALGLATAFFCMLFLFGLYDSASLDFVALAKYAILLTLCVLLPLTADRRALAIAVVLIATWAVTLALFQLRYGVTLDPSRGQHYLTVGYALGSGSLIGLVMVVSTRPWSARITGVILFLVCMTAAATLLGRGPVIFPVLAVLAYYLVNPVAARRPGRLIARVLTILMLALPLAYASHRSSIAVNLEDRLSRLASIRDEPRVTETYLPAMEAIADQPLGYGLQAHDRLIGFYPHNIFLEIWLSAGIAGLLLFGALMVMFLRHFGFVARNCSALTARCAYLMTFYFFLIWNVSFDLASAYAVVPMMVLFGSMSRGELRGRWGAGNWRPARPESRDL